MWVCLNCHELNGGDKQACTSCHAARLQSPAPKGRQEHKKASFFNDIKTMYTHAGPRHWQIAKRQVSEPEGVPIRQLAKNPAKKIPKEPVERSNHCREDYLVVAALDLGTAYSAYAFSMKGNFQSDPLKIHVNQPWNAGGRQLLSLKTPTCLLLNDNKKFEAFGYEAEKKYADLVMDDEHHNYFFFQRFKKNLHNNKAGIPKNQILLAPEPEAASIYCQYLPTEKLHGERAEFTMSDTGTRYMVVDLGGETADITVHEKVSAEHLKELVCATGNDCGGNSVDGLFFQMFTKLLGGPLMKSLMEDDPSSYLDLFRDIETIKWTINTKNSGKVNITIPSTALDQKCNEILGEGFPSVIADSSLSNEITLHGDKMRFNVDIIRNLFKSTIDDIISLMKDILHKPTTSDVSHLLFVGGLSECPLVLDGIKAAFPDKRVIVPEDSGLSVLKGAVLFGHKPDYVQSRVMRFSYGVGTSEIFDPAIHDEAHRAEGENGDLAKNVFDIIVRKNQNIDMGTAIESEFHTTESMQESFELQLYVSTKEEPMFVDEEGCTLLGSAEVIFSEPCEGRRIVKVTFIFGNTELGMTAVDSVSGQTFKASLNLT